MKDYFCTGINESLLNKKVTISGWVATRRDHGGVIFVDLRDHTGILQIVFNPENKEVFKNAENIRNEYVIQISGKVTKRIAGTVNKDLPQHKILQECNHLHLQVKIIFLLELELGFQTLH